MGSTGVELAMSMDNGASDIRPVNVAKPTGASGKPKIMKRSVIRVTVELEVMMETKQYLHFYRNCQSCSACMSFRTYVAE